MIDKKEAEIIASEYLENLEADIGEPIRLNHAKTIEEEFGWIFFYDTECYLETGNFIDKLAGNAPFIVNKKTKEIVTLGTAESLGVYIEQYKKSLF